MLNSGTADLPHFFGLNTRTSETGGAVFDAANKYRYLLWRDLSAGKGTLLMVMLNPNLADETRNDPTIRRCIGFARTWGFGRVEVVNLFGFKAEKPSMLRAVRQPVGASNDDFIRGSVEGADFVVAAWGNHGSLLDRDEKVTRLLRNFGPIYCLGRTNSGMPRHPLYVRADVRPVEFDVRLTPPLRR